MNDDRPFLQIPAPSSHDAELYEEWLKKKQQEDDDPQEEDRVIILQI